MTEAKRIPTEHDEQVSFVRWWRLQFRGVRIIAIPNGGHRRKAVAGKLKSEGVEPGVPDLFVPRESLWIEMKRQKGGRLSDWQKLWREYLEGIGHTVIIAKGAADARRQVLDLMRGRRK